jgi:hypothetical protein
LPSGGAGLRATLIGAVLAFLNVAGASTSYLQVEYKSITLRTKRTAPEVNWDLLLHWKGGTSMAAFHELLTYAAVAGNALFILWMLYNGMDEGWQATPYQLLSYAGLAVLLMLNTYLVLRRSRVQ